MHRIGEGLRKVLSCCLLVVYLTAAATPGEVAGAGVSADIQSYSIGPTDTQAGETVTFRLDIANTGSSSWTFWGQLALKRPDGQFLNNLPCKPVTIAAGQVGSATWTYTVDQEGLWDAFFRVWQDSAQTTPLDSTVWLSGIIHASSPGTTSIPSDMPSYYISPTQTQVTRTVTFRPTIANREATTCTFTVMLYLKRPDGTEIGNFAYQSLTLSAGQQGNVTWTYAVDQAGLWDVAVEVWREPERITLVAGTGWMPDIISVSASPSLILAQTGGSTTVSESGAGDTYTVALTTQPAGEVTVTLAGQVPLCL